MPIFEYLCRKCGHTNEFLVLGPGEKLRCRNCGGEDLTKLMSAHSTFSPSGVGSSEKGAASCCGSPNSCDTPGGCCSRRD